jgi:uncharacterized Tic20 family protein
MSYSPYDYGANQYGPPPMSDFTTPHGGLGGLTPQERSDAAAANYLGLICLASPLFGWIGPLAYRSGAGTGSAFVLASATAALNFHLSALIYFGVAMLTGCVLGIISGVLGLAGVSISITAMLCFLAGGLGMMAWQIVASCIGGSHANRGEIYRYPGSLRLVK